MREVSSGETIVLTAEFFRFDTSGNKVMTDPDDTPLVSVYDPLHDPRDSSTDLVADAAVYQQAATKLTTGIYQYSYTTDADIDTNWWFDVWEASVDSISGIAHMQFLIIGAELSEQVLSHNQLITVTLASTIEDTSGNQLGEEYRFAFITTFNPFYSDAKLMRAYAGSWITSVGDDTLSLMIYESSKEADLITPPYIEKNARVFYEARKNFTTYNAILKLLEMPINQGGMTKMLGDLLVKREGASFLDMINRITDNKRKWEAVVNDGGATGLNQSRPPLITSKGILDPDRRQIGRLWVTPHDGDWPVANGKTRQTPYRRWKFDEV